MEKNTDIKKLIQDFMDSKAEVGQEEYIKLEMKSINEYAILFSELGFNTLVNNSMNLNGETDEDGNEDGNRYDSNGWQVDFWWTIHFGKIPYRFAGSLFYGDFTLSKN